MQGANTFGRGVAAGSLLCALIAVGILARNSLLDPESEETWRPVLVVDSIHIPEWSKYSGNGGHQFGPPSAKVTVTVFTDFECPACRQFTETALAGARVTYRDQLRLVLRHWPLAIHRFAIPAARAAECAGAQDRFLPFHDLVFAKQDSLGLKSFASYAREAGVEDSLAFDRCYQSAAPIEALAVDTPLVAELGGRGTPLILVNDLVLLRGIDSAGFDAIIQADLAGP